MARLRWNDDKLHIKIVLSQGNIEKDDASAGGGSLTEHLYFTIWNTYYLLIAAVKRLAVIKINELDTSYDQYVNKNQQWMCVSLKKSGKNKNRLNSTSNKLLILLLHLNKSVV